MYTLQNMHTLLAERRILVIGDSLGRRASSTLAFLLEKFARGDNEDVSVAALDRDADNSYFHVGFNPHEYNVSTKGLHFRWAPMFHSLSKVLCAHDAKENGLRGVSDVVIFAGFHDSASIFWPNTTSIILDSRKRYEFHAQTIDNVLNCIHESNSDARVFWRTAPYAYFNYSTGHTAAVNNEVQQVNKFARAECLNHSYCTLVDAEKLLRHKSVGAERIAGDTGAHYGSLARLAVIQLLLRAMDLTSTELV
jgi:hypothetical protein